MFLKIHHVWHKTMFEEVWWGFLYFSYFYPSTRYPRFLFLRKWFCQVQAFCLPSSLSSWKAMWRDDENDDWHWAEVVLFRPFYAPDVRLCAMTCNDGCAGDLDDLFATDHHSVCDFPEWFVWGFLDWIEIGSLTFTIEVKFVWISGNGHGGVISSF